MHDADVHGAASTPETCVDSIPMTSQQNYAQSVDTPLVGAGSIDYIRNQGVGASNGTSPEHSGSNNISSHGDLNYDSNMPIPIPAALKSV
ncbi:hypothetical protein V6N12_055582 [Hibiscus sabdariffa]|uniref:Uncharacterized protein n=1 Tax=Hibiscus sabdariffa TaxID=183260 RepID=A0ABR2BVH7_9ROSI